MARLYGRAPRGERCRAPVPHGHWKTTTFTAGLRYDGIAAPMVLDGPMNGDANSKSLKGSGSEVEPPAAMPAYGVPITESTHP